ncbi:MAG: GNVR domain-containing protein [Caulobacteraceae bacterium]|nr:GNVR domain-containing protein [Caulobacteraceae bacterium]
MNFTSYTLAPSTRTSELERGDTLHRWLVVFRSRSRLFACVALVIIASSALVTLQVTPRYTATSRVMIDPRHHEVSDIPDVLGGLGNDSNIIDTEVRILESRSLAERVVAAQKLDQDPEFNAALRRPSAARAALAGLIGELDLFGPTPPQVDARLQALEAHEAVVDAALSRLKVHRAGLTFVIDISFQSEDPAKAARIANAFANLYLTQQLQEKYEATQQATLWIEHRLADLQPKVAAAATAVETYKAQHGLLETVGSTLTQQEVSNLNDQLAVAQAAEAAAEARLQTAQQALASGADGQNLSGPLNSPTVIQLRSQGAELSGRLAALQSRYGPAHPEVQRAARALADNVAQIHSEVARQLSSLKSEEEIARGRVASLQGSLDHAKATLAGNGAASVELADLQRQASAISSLYDSLLNRVQQTTASQGDETPDSRVISLAKSPTAPSYPSIGLNLALGLLLGLAGGTASVLLAESLDSGLATSADVERALSAPHLGAIPALNSTLTGKPVRTTPETYVVERPLSTFAEAFRNLRTSIQFSKIDTKVKVILVTSSLPGEGKTTTAFCLGRSMGLSGSRVVVVDCDLHRRGVNRLLDVEPSVGLVEVLQGSASLDEALVLDEPSGAWFLPQARTRHTPRDLFGSQAMDRLLAELRDRFDLVLLDTAPVLPIADTRVLAPKADVVVFLAKWRTTPIKAVTLALGLLTSVGADIAGVALTLVDAKRHAKYGYGDGSYYYYRAYRSYRPYPTGQNENVL